MLRGLVVALDEALTTAPVGPLKVEPTALAKYAPLRAPEALDLPPSILKTPLAGTMDAQQESALWRQHVVVGRFSGRRSTRRLDELSNRCRHISEPFGIVLIRGPDLWLKSASLAEPLLSFRRELRIMRFQIHQLHVDAVWIPKLLRWRRAKFRVQPSE